jgi:hypothetical protein
VSETPFTIKVQGQGLDETAQGFQKLGDSVETAASKIEGVKLDPQTLDSTAQAATTAATAIEDLGSSGQTAAPKIEDTAAAIEKAGTAAKRAGDGMSDLERAMSGTWGQRGQQDLGIFVDYAKQAGSATDSATISIGKLGEVFNQVGGRGAAANDILEASQALLKGNERAGLAAAKGIGAFISSFSMGALGIFLSTLGLVTAATVSWITKSKEAKAASDALATTIAALAKEFAQLNNTPQDKLAEAINTNNRALDEQLRKLQAIAEIEDARAKAQYELDKSNLDRERRTREASGNPMSEREYAARQNQIETAEGNRLAGRPVDLARQQASAAATAAARAEETAAKTFDETAQKLAEIDYDGARKLREVYAKYTEEMAAASAANSIRAATERYGQANTQAQAEELAARQKAAGYAAILARYGIDAAADQKTVNNQIERENKTRQEQAKEQASLQKAADDAALAAKEKAAELQERANTEKAKYDAAEPARRAIQANANDQRTTDATKSDNATAEDRKKAQAELDKLKADTEAAAQERSKTPAGYFYTDEERAAIAEKQKAIDKMGPATPTAPTAPAKPVKTTTYAPRTAAEKAGQTPGADQPTGQSDQLPDLAGPINDATKAVESAAPALAEQLQPAVDATKDFAAKVPELKLDGAPLAAGIQASTTAITALQQANTSVLTDVLSLVKEQNTTIKTLATQTNSLRVEVGQLRAQVRNAA